MSYYTPTPAILELSRRLNEIQKQGVANVRAGLPGILALGSALGEEFEVTYEKWMNLRAQAGDKFALSLGYGRPHV